MATKKTTKKTTKNTKNTKNTKTEIPSNLVLTELAGQAFAVSTAHYPMYVKGTFYVKEKTRNGVSFVEVKPEFWADLGEDGEISVSWKVPGRPKADVLYIDDCGSIVPCDADEDGSRVRGVYRAYGQEYEFDFVRPEEDYDRLCAVFYGKGDAKRIYELKPGRYPIVGGRIEVRPEDEKGEPDMLPVHHAEQEINWRTMRLPGSDRGLCEACSVSKEAVGILEDAFRRVGDMGYYPVFDKESDYLCLVSDHVRVSSYYPDCKGKIRVPESACEPVADIVSFSDDHCFYIGDSEE